VGAGDLASPSGPAESELERFRHAGRYLAARGFVRATEGNLSTFDGSRLVITRTGSDLAALGSGDVLAGTLDAPPEGSTSDLAIHVETYERSFRLDGVRAIAHAHPPGSMPEPGASYPRHGRHGVYGTGRTLEQALAMVELVVSSPPPSWPGTIASPFSPVELSLRGEWGGERVSGPVLRGFDQSRVPFSVDEGFRCRTVEEVAEVVRRLAVRGAPILGIATALGVALAAFRALERDEPVRESAEKAAELLVSTRPTAVNMRWAADRVLAAARGAGDDRAFADALLTEARRIEHEDADACSTMGWFGAELVPPTARVLTHCNTGMLCTAGIGTALGVIWCARVAGKIEHVWVDETRPLLQGSRLTAWELDQLGVPQTVIPDSAAASLMAAGAVDLVVTGADRVAANGDVANKIGTYGLAVLARHHDVPFYVAAPASTIDLKTAVGSAIRIEERDPAEVTRPFGMAIAPDGVSAANPAFDVTPAELVTALVTERGVVRNPDEAGLRALLEQGGDA
jgi:methylthioribose-1-phosphate isomerase